MNDEQKKAVAAFYRLHADVPTLLRAADDLCRQNVTIFGATYAAEEPLQTLLARLTEGRRQRRGFVISSGDPYLVQVPVRQREALFGRAMVKAFLWQSASDSIVHLLGVKEDFKYVAKELRSYLLTDLTPVYLQTPAFRRAFDALTSAEAVTGIAVHDYTALLLTDDAKHVETRRGWLPEPKDYGDFFDKLQEENQWVRSLGILVSSNRTAKGRVKRDLSFSCEMDFHLFFGTVVAELRRVAAEIRGIFIDRSATASPTRTSRPLQIAYQTPIFEDKKQNRRLIRVLHGLSDSALSVFHPNPYLHASLVDYVDGSSYTIWITDNSSIAIVPEFKASPGSLERLCNHIAEHFGEGDIQEIPA